ncbi:MAG: FG-GAP repeat protein, partial [Chloroflexi bacterium]|nr:FG-GAP repeat protein [Chloroflexota bacterium]
MRQGTVYRLGQVCSSKLSMLTVLALLLSSLWLQPAIRISVPSVEWPRPISALATGNSASRESGLLYGPASDAAKPQPPFGVSAQRWAAIQETIRRDLYSISATESGYLAENRAQRLSLAFDADGLTVGPAPRTKAPGAFGQGPSFAEASTEGEQKWTWGLTLVGYGYAGHILPVSAARVSTQDNRLTYSRGDGSGASLLDEWYVNEQRGLEQGFTVSQPQDTGGLGRSGQMVALDLRLRGDLVPASVDDGARSIDFLAEGGGIVLRYGELHVEDATGRMLPARLTIVSLADSAGQSIRILVDDADAIYPLVVDPLVTSQANKLTASDAAANDEFGISVAIDVDTIVVGAYGNASYKGAAYVFARNQGGPDNWGQAKKLTASDGAANDWFGISVAIDVDTIVVGALRNSSLQGAAYVFARNQGGADNWGQAKKLTASDGAINDSFGVSVAIDRDTIVVGAFGKSIGLGAAYVFARNQGGPDNWGQAKKLTASDGAAIDRFGVSVAIDVDTIVVGAHTKSSAQGAAYVFARNQGGADNWGQAKELTASDGAPGDQFGISVAIDVDTIVVGANGNSGQGAAYVFARNQGGADNWGQAKKLTASDGAAGNTFGVSVAIDRDTIVVG